MKTLGGVGAVVLGGMLLLTVKIGPAPSPPDPSRPMKIDPGTAVAAVPDAPPRRTPAAVAPAPLRLRAVSASEDCKAARSALVEPAKTEPLGWAWAVSLPASVLCL